MERSNRTRRVVALLALGAVVALGGCGDDAEEVAEVVLTEPGAAVTVEVGTEVVIDLESIAASTGYSWELRQPLDDAVLEVEGTSVIGAPGDEPGTPGRYRLTLGAVGPGTAVVDLWEVQPWLDDPEPNREAMFTVTVS